MCVIKVVSRAKHASNNSLVVYEMSVDELAGGEMIVGET